MDMELCSVASDEGCEVELATDEDCGLAGDAEGCCFKVSRED